jgi:hypothetical protein
VKKLTLLLSLTALTISSFAQYKKASFFNKEGRTYELGTNASFFSNSTDGPAYSIVYTVSLESSKPLTYYSDIEFMMKRKFAYTGTYYSYNAGGQNVTEKLSGNAPSYLLLKYGAQYRFSDPKKGADAKLVPYAKLGILVGLGLKGDYNMTSASGETVAGSDIDPAIPIIEAPFGLELGAGATYYFAKNFGVKLGAGYRQIFNIKGFRGNDGSANYYPFKNNPMLTLSLKYRIFTED